MLQHPRNPGHPGNRPGGPDRPPQFIIDKASACPWKCAEQWITSMYLKSKSTGACTGAISRCFVCNGVWEMNGMGVIIDMRVVPSLECCLQCLMPITPGTQKEDHLCNVGV